MAWDSLAAKGDRHKKLSPALNLSGEFVLHSLGDTYGTRREGWDWRAGDLMKVTSLSNALRSPLGRQG